MPFRRAHWTLILLAPIIGVAFWPQYFGRLPAASFAFHAHGLTATVWLSLLTLQAWSAQQSDRRLHRFAGGAVFVIAPLFAAAAVLVLHSMATKFATRSDPFYAALGARLGGHDIISTVALVGFVAFALRHRRKVVLHGAGMLATALLVLPPVISRLPIPRFFHSGELIVIALAATAAWLEPRARGVFGAVATLQILHIAAFETVFASAAWARGSVAFSHLPVTPFAIASGAAALMSLSWAWRGPRRSLGADARQPVA